ncbi:hypothetical protein [Cryobacterium sp. TMT1-19]|nr:hypothetical protein [Cryobacterium sp. TMT1-19]
MSRPIAMAAAASVRSRSSSINPDLVVPAETSNAEAEQPAA